MDRVFDGVLFDFDGTLADTMNAHFAAWRKALSPLGVYLNPDDYFPLEGTPVPELAKIFSRHIAGVDCASIIRDKENYFVESSIFAPYPGVLDLVDRLVFAGISIGIVTAGLKNRIDRSVPAGFLSKFHVVITGERGGRGKPFPDPYLRGARSLQVAPDKCLVVENAPLGIIAAKTAGCYCVAIAATMDSVHLRQADRVFDSMIDLASKLRTQNHSIMLAAGD